MRWRNFSIAFFFILNPGPLVTLPPPYLKNYSQALNRQLTAMQSGVVPVYSFPLAGFIGRW